MMSAETTSVIVEDELVAARFWAKRHNLELTWLPKSLEIRCVLTQPNTGNQFFLHGDAENYKEEPPAWTFRGSSWQGGTNRHDYPGQIVGAPGSTIFHSKGVLCAPFNRLAFKRNGGPHGDWGTPAQWMSAQGNYVQAHTIGDMLAVIYRDFQYSTGRLA